MNNINRGEMPKTSRESFANFPDLCTYAAAESISAPTPARKRLIYRKERSGRSSIFNYIFSREEVFCEAVECRRVTFRQAHGAFATLCFGLFTLLIYLQSGPRTPERALCICGTNKASRVFFIHILSR